MNKFTISASGLHSQGSHIIFDIIAAVACYICIFPLFMIDIFIWQFQNIYFRNFQIPLIQRSQYIVLDRFSLSKLTFWQRINCLYCEYANGLIAFAKAVVNQMELYSCAIKHVHQPLGQEHQKDFFERDRFE